VGEAASDEVELEDKANFKVDRDAPNVTEAITKREMSTDEANGKDIERTDKMEEHTTTRNNAITSEHSEKRQMPYLIHI
jgi:hypothetical protein